MFNPHIARRRHKLWRKLISINKFLALLVAMLYASLCLNEIRKNLASYLERSPLTHSHGYGPQGGGQDAWSNFVAFMQYAD